MEKLCFTTANLDETDNLVLKSMVSLLENHIKMEMVAVDQPEMAHIIFIDVDRTQGVELFQQFSKTKSIIIALTQATTPTLDINLLLQKPIRSKNLLEIIKKISNYLDKTKVYATPKIKVLDTEDHLLSFILALDDEQIVELMSFNNHSANFTIDKKNNKYYTQLSQQSLLELINEPVSHFIITDNPPIPPIEAYPLESLIWSIALDTSQGSICPTIPLEGRFSLKSWVNFKLLPYKQVHLRLASYMMQNTGTIFEISQQTKIPYHEVVNWINACYSIGVLAINQNKTHKKHKPIIDKGLIEKIRNRLFINRKQAIK